jgi:phage shock protein A
MSSIIDRINTLLKANIHDLLDKAEDPEKMIHQLIRDMEAEYERAKTHVVESMAHEKKMEREYLAAQGLAQDWEGKAASALRANREDLARESLARKLAYERTATDLKGQLEQQTQAVTALQQQLHALNAKIEDAKRQKDVILARQKRVQAEQHMRATSSMLRYSDTAFAAFDRIKGRVEDDEGILEAARELEQQQTTEAKFAAMERDSEIDLALAELKAKMANESGAATS